MDTVISINLLLYYVDTGEYVTPTFRLVYTGHVSYVREGKNKWTMKFTVIKNINVFIKVIIMNISSHSTSLWNLLFI